MKKILVLGAGFVAGPLVRYFLEWPSAKVIVADIDVEKAKLLIGLHPRGKAMSFNVKDEEALKARIAEADIVISLVPHMFHPLVAKICVALGKNMVTTSYVSKAMKALDADSRRAGIVLLNEVGCDPGIDHMEAMQIIDEIKDAGGTILGFTSYCGGLPAPEANTNPFGYKFSWSPRDMLLAGKDAALYLKDGKEIYVPAESLFDHYALIPIKGLGDFEGYPNRDSFPYIELYGIRETQTMFRGTLRYPGWCETLRKIGEIGLFDQTEIDFRGQTVLGLVRSLIGGGNEKDIKSALRIKLNLRPDSKILDRLEWLGLFSPEPVPLKKGCPLDALEILMLEKLRYEKGERDMVILQHEIMARDAAGKKQRISSTFVDFGIPGGDSSMARLVGLSAAAGARLILEGKIRRTGVMIPVHPEIYGPILEELKGHGIIFKEKKDTAA